MMPDSELLAYIHKTADMGVAGVEGVLPRTQDDHLKTVLEKQREQYVHIRDDARKMLEKQGKRAGEASSIAKFSADMMCAGKLLMDPSSSKVAEMMIQGTTMGVTKTIRHLRDFAGDDQPTLALGQRLLDMQENNVEEMKRFL